MLFHPLLAQLYANQYIVSNELYRCINTVSAPSGSLLEHVSFLAVTGDIFLGHLHTSTVTQPAWPDILIILALKGLSHQEFLDLYDVKCSGSRSTWS